MVTGPLSQLGPPNLTCVLETRLFWDGVEGQGHEVDGAQKLLAYRLLLVHHE